MNGWRSPKVLGLYTDELQMTSIDRDIQETDEGDG